ncbi:putative cytokinetic ring protein SteA [Microaerobacter geothermalis]|uniref:putative cytokinetic ring protein SteA n=1 Tax=Microaerobacter geothermalis TaxID=674972 RepID=UPI001F41F5EC|nr:putative cytokinetic ring protein SteA [Microaerobacter geothermalis]MCF6094430.1 putative cytokinetic ring protein SteA [Microaerobacter geothermalis]
MVTKKESPMIQGFVKADSKTKNLMKRLLPGNIAVIKHPDVDEVAAKGLLESKVKAIINANPMLSGKYPAYGASYLLDHGIPLFEMGEEHFSLFSDGMEVNIDCGLDHLFILDDQHKIPLQKVTKEKIEKKLMEAKKNLPNTLKQFIDNTLIYAQREKDYFLQSLYIPALKTAIRGRHVLVVVRGTHYKEDLLAIRSYIKDYKPVLLGVDGGADALKEFGFIPDIILGDMDSVQDETLKFAKDLVVHAYPNGDAPGMKRIHQLGLKAITIPAPGTSEDIAMLLAYEKGAELIVTVGTHSNMIDFLEKGRKGMGSTVLVRMKIGNKLVDAKGVSKLYPGRIGWKPLAALGLSAVVPILALFVVSPVVRHLWQLLWIQVKMLLT